MTFRILRPDTAFSEPRKQRSPRKKEGAHLDFIRSLPCLICGAYGCHAAHIRYGSQAYYKRETGIGEKPDDRWTVPLCKTHHTDGPEAQHKANEQEWWRSHGIEPLAVARDLFLFSGEEDVAERIIASARASRSAA